MQLLISFTTKDNARNINLNDLFVVFDVNKKQFIRKLNFKASIRKIANVHRATGMCYYKNFWYAGITHYTHRVGSKLLIVDLNNGKQTINDLFLTKAIHSIFPLCECKIYNMILACSTQNDCVSIITTFNTKVVTEDIFIDYLSDSKRLKLNWSKEYLWDDLLHANNICINNGDIYSCMFHDYNLRNKEEEKEKMNETKKYWRQNKEKMIGAVYNITNQKLLRKTVQPHSLIVNQFNEKVFCESGTFKLINIDKNQEAQCNGFTRGLWEDKQRGGYWVGLSYHRVFSTKLDGAALQFVSYNMEIKDFIDLSIYGKEIYDVIPYKKGEWKR